MFASCFHPCHAIALALLALRVRLSLLRARCCYFGCTVVFAARLPHIGSNAVWDHIFAPHSICNAHFLEGWIYRPKHLYI